MPRSLFRPRAKTANGAATPSLARTSKSSPAFGVDEEKNVQSQSPSPFSGGGGGGGRGGGFSTSGSATGKLIPRPNAVERPFARSSSSSLSLSSTSSFSYSAHFSPSPRPPTAAPAAAPDTDRVKEKEDEPAHDRPSLPIQDQSSPRARTSRSASASDDGNGNGNGNGNEMSMPPTHATQSAPLQPHCETMYRVCVNGQPMGVKKEGFTTVRHTRLASSNKSAKRGLRKASPSPSPSSPGVVGGDADRGAGSGSNSHAEKSPLTLGRLLKEPFCKSARKDRSAWSPLGWGWGWDTVRSPLYIYDYCRRVL